MKTRIKDIKAREILDCRGEPTIEVDVITEDGTLGRAAVPCGLSKGEHEALEIRDGGNRYAGRGVKKAIDNVHEIIRPALFGKNSVKQREIDELLIELDGTPNKSKLGANAIVGVSLAVAKAAANALGKPLYKHIGGDGPHILPVPVLDMIEGGLLAASGLDFQEHQVMPVGAESFSEAIRMGMEVYYKLGEILEKEWGRESLNVGAEGGYTPQAMNDPRNALDAEWKAIVELGYQDKFVMSLDVAASHFYDKQEKKYKFMGKKITSEELIEYYLELVNDYPLVSIEDPLQEDDYEGYAKLTSALDIQIIGDDFFTTNPERIKRGIEEGAANAVLLKVNQIGTLSEALDAAQLAFKNNFGVQVSERSGETEDTWLADLAVAINSGQIKTGVTRSERTCKYNRLLRIEESDKSLKYAGWNFRHPC
ncbi:MAG TPA: phosphopyruvate hydratase [Candidatus Aminicenantes bacterium]|nr:phosphopyruvate hydratase [Candidatus Aminicenantes bacterium]